MLLRLLRSVVVLALVTFAAVACRRDGATGNDASPSAAGDADLENDADGGLADGGGDADIVTHASWLVDAGGGVRTTESVDAAVLRAKHRPRLAQRAPVVVLKGGTPRDLGERLCKEVVPQRPLDAPVLIKPNIGGFDWSRTPRAPAATMACAAASPTRTSCAASCNA